MSADGTSVTSVVTTANGLCIGGPGGLKQLSTNSTFAFPIAGSAFSGDDPNDPPYLRMAGTFTAQDASGTLSVFFGSSFPSFYTCNALDKTWSASTTGGGGGGGGGGGDAGAGGGDVGGGGGDQGGGGGGAGLGPPAITISFPKGVLWKPSVSNGFVVSVGVDQLSTLTGNLVLGKKLAKKYGLGSKARVIAKAKVTNAGPDSALEFKFAKAIRSKLKNAKSIKLILDVIAKRADGVTGKGSQTLKFN